MFFFFVFFCRVQRVHRFLRVRDRVWRVIKFYCINFLHCLKVAMFWMWRALIFEMVWLLALSACLSICFSSMVLATKFTLFFVCRRSVFCFPQVYCNAAYFVDCWGRNTTSIQNTEYLYCHFRSPTHLSKSRSAVLNSLSLRCVSITPHTFLSLTSVSATLPQLRVDANVFDSVI
jgi:hypothetical protein